MRNLQENKVSEHVITELELQCKLGTFKATSTLGVEFYLLYRYTHTSQFNPVESILIEICQWWVGYQTMVVIWSLIFSLLPLVFVPSMADTDPQIFCKRFQLYLGDIEYVSPNVPQINHMCWWDHVLNVMLTSIKCTLLWLMDIPFISCCCCSLFPH